MWITTCFSGRRALLFTFYPQTLGVSEWMLEMAEGRESLKSGFRPQAVENLVDMCGWSLDVFSRGRWNTINTARWARSQ